MHNFPTKAVATEAGSELYPWLSHCYAISLRCSITFTQMISLCELATS